MGTLWTAIGLNIVMIVGAVMLIFTRQARDTGLGLITLLGLATTVIYMFATVPLQSNTPLIPAVIVIAVTMCYGTAWAVLGHIASSRNRAAATQQPARRASASVTQRMDFLPWDDRGSGSFPARLR